jgi:hypothetical protein
MKHKKSTSSNRIPCSIGKLSIRQQLPLLICLLLLVLILLFGTVSYLGVRRASMAIGEQRLRSLTEELSSMFQQSGSTLSASTQAFARQQDIVHFFDTDTGSFTDDGIGFLPGNIRNRVGIYNGEVDISSEPGKGCVLTVTIPLASPIKKK